MNNTDIINRLTETDLERMKATTKHQCVDCYYYNCSSGAEPCKRCNQCEGEEDLFDNDKMRLIAACHALIKEQETDELTPLREELGRARAKFPDSRLMFAAMIEEVGEVGNAIIEGKDWRAEALQVACTAMRLRSEGDAAYGLPAITESELKAQPDKSTRLKQILDELENMSETEQAALKPDLQRLADRIADLESRRQRERP